jgi:hypothetical protein
MARNSSSKMSFRAAGGGGEPERGATLREASEVSLIDRREKRLEGGKE